MDCGKQFGNKMLVFKAETYPFQFNNSYVFLLCWRKLRNNWWFANFTIQIGWFLLII